MSVLKALIRRSQSLAYILGSVHHSPVRMGENVFIGLNSTILRGVTIAGNVVVAAGSVVTRAISSDSVWGGVPAKFINPWMTPRGASKTKPFPLRAFGNREAAISAEQIQVDCQAIECRGENIGSVTTR